MKTDLYQSVTDQIVASLEQGVRPWMKPWNAEHAAGRITRPLRANGIAYQGINVLVLWSESVAKGYSAPIWMTFRQALELDACVRKGERGSTVVYASTITRSGTDQETGEDCQETIPFLKSYTVFNVEQIEGLPARFHAVAEPRLDPVRRIERAESFFAATRADIRHGGNMAYYNIDSDFVQMPPFEAFRDAESYYAALAHECAHWTRAKSRLDRDLGRKKWGDALIDNQPIVKAFVNSATVRLLLDTGAEATVLTPAAAQRIGAQHAGFKLGRQMHGITGDIPVGELELRSFTIGGVEVARRGVRVAPIEIVNAVSGPLDGVLGADTLSSFDIDLDLPGRRMTLYQGQSCTAASPAWAQPYARIAAGRSPNNRLYFAVQLDGRRISALFDTGAQFSVLSTALALGVSDAVLARDPAVTMRGVDGAQLSAHAHRFFRLEVDGEVTRNAEIDVSEIGLNDADFVLGIDFLGSRRIWISYGSQQLFLMRRI